MHSQHAAEVPAGQSQQSDPRVNCENAANGHAADVLWRSGRRDRPSVQSAVARLACVDAGHEAMVRGPLGEFIVAAATSVGKRSTSSTSACEMPGASPGTEIMKGMCVACSKLVCLANSALSPNAYP